MNSLRRLCALCNMCRPATAYSNNTLGLALPVGDKVRNSTGAGPRSTVTQYQGDAVS